MYRASIVLCYQKLRGGEGHTISEVTGSLWTAAVSPTPEEPLPVVYTALGEMWAMCLISCDLATPGSPADSNLALACSSPTQDVLVAAHKATQSATCTQLRRIKAVALMTDLGKNAAKSSEGHGPLLSLLLGYVLASMSQH